MGTRKHKRGRQEPEPSHSRVLTPPGCYLLDLNLTQLCSWENHHPLLAGGRNRASSPDHRVIPKAPRRIPLALSPPFHSHSPGRRGENFGVQFGQTHTLLLVVSQGLHPGLHRTPGRGDRELAPAQHGRLGT